MVRFEEDFVAPGIYSNYLPCLNSGPVYLGLVTVSRCTIL